MKKTEVLRETAAQQRGCPVADVDLLPCPFCGSADAPRLKNTHTASFWVSCPEEDGGCGAQASGQFFPGPSRRTRFCYDPEAPEGSTSYARTLGELHPEYRRAAKSAIAAWNRRANVAQAELQGEAEGRAERLGKTLGAYQAAVNKIDDLIEYSLPMPPKTKAALYAVLADLTAALAKELTND